LRNLNNQIFTQKIRQHHMNEHFKSIILQSTGASDFTNTQMIQSLWSGYGEILRIGLKNSEHQSVVVKHVNLPKGGNHPRGWNTDLSHERKVRSYEVEMEWYKKWAEKCDDSCRIPKCYALEWQGREVLMVMEDLDVSGFPKRRSSVTWDEIEACIKWLANFHAIYLHEKPEGLWETGTYWHLETRPEELEVLDDQELKNAASAIDLLLKNSPYQTFVHGDAKLANFCFSKDGKNVAAVDFQYVGGGCGMKDLAYFVGSCLHEEDCEKLEKALLDCYFTEFRIAIEKHKPKLEADKIETNWRKLYPLAWTDFHRFLKGWSPGHWKINSYSERLVREVVGSIK